MSCGKEEQAHEGGFCVKKVFVALALTFVFSIILTSSVPVCAETETNWPEKRIEMIWHSKAGSGGDIYLRALARFLEKKTGQTVIVNNVTGASGANAWMKVAKANPDGYTILGVSSTIVASPVVNNLTVNYENFDHVARMFIDAVCLFVAADSPYKTLEDLIADAKKRPGEVTLAGGTAGNIEFVAARELMKEAGCEVSIVPFEGGGDGAVSVLGGHVSAGVGEYAEIASSAEAGKLRILATFNKLQDKSIPTVAEAGYPNVTVEKLRGIFVPKGTPKPVIEKLTKLLKEAMEDPDFKAYYTANNLIPAFVEGEEFTKILALQTEQVKESIGQQKK